MPSTQQEWKTIAAQFSNQWNFANCIGALDGKHIQIFPPPNSGSLFYNYKHFSSIVLLGLVDAGYKFLYVDIGSYGRISDGGVFSSCSLSTALETNVLHIPSDLKLPGSDITTPAVIVADDAFPLKTFLMKPYGSKNLTQQQRIYNYRLSRARRVVENAFGILSSRFRVFGKAIALAPDKVQIIVMAACCLHNFLMRNAISAAQYLPDDENPTSDLQHIAQQGSNRASANALAIRNLFCDYFNNDIGSVSWQASHIT